MCERIHLRVHAQVLTGAVLRVRCTRKSTFDLNHINQLRLVIHKYVYGSTDYAITVYVVYSIHVTRTCSSEISTRSGPHTPTHPFSLSLCYSECWYPGTFFALVLFGENSLVMRSSNRKILIIYQYETMWDCSPRNRNGFRLKRFWIPFDFSCKPLLALVFDERALTPFALDSLVGLVDSAAIISI